MPSRYRFIAIVLGLLWLPAMLHCRLEAAVAHENKPVECCDHGAPGEDATCLVDNCDLFNRGHLRDSEGDAVDLPSLLPQNASVLAVVESLVGSGPIQRTASTAPLELVPSWAFSRRTAAPARAPGLTD